MPDKSNKIKILYIYPSLMVGGAEELRFVSLKGMQHKDGYEIKICCIEDIGEIGEKIRNLGIEVFCLNRSSKPYNVFTTISLLTYLLKNKFDIVQTVLFNANFHGRIAASLARVPIIISEEHSEHYQYNSLKFLPYIWSDRILARFTDKIICCSRNLMDSISKLENIPSGKLFTLINTFNIDKLKITKDTLELKRELGLGKDNLIIGNIASLCPRKGQDILIKAFKIINHKFPSTRLIFIGSEIPEFKEKLLNLMRSLALSEKVFFLGKKDNIANYLNIMDVLAFSSLFEGIPLAMLEAMYMQVPVVSTNVGGVSEVIRDNETGILVPAQDPGVLSDSIIDLLSNTDKRINLVRAAREEVMNRFRPQRYIEDLESLYSQIIQEKFI